jgi:hypothetical protein
MLYKEAFGTLTVMMADAGLAAKSLEPWRSWKVFKAFMRLPMDDVVDDATVQFSLLEDLEGGRHAYLYFVREFSIPGVDESEPLGQLGCELIFKPAVLAEIEPDEFWTQDSRTFDAFVDRVESSEGFGAFLVARPTETTIFREELASSQEPDQVAADAPRV